MGAFLLWAAAGSRSATASDSDLFVSIRYSVDDSARGCWDEAEFRRRVAQRIGYDPFRDEAPVNVKVHIGGASNAVDGRVEWRRSNGAIMGERRFVAKDGDCRNLLTEMSFTVGLQIELLKPKASADADAVPRPQDVDAAEAQATVPSKKAEGLSTEENSAASRAQPRREEAKAADVRDQATAGEPSQAPAWVGLGPSLAWRLSPAATADARLFLGMRLADLSFEIAGEATYPSTQSRWDQSGFRYTMLGGSIAVCGHHQWLSACGLGRANAVRATGTGVTKPRSPTGFVVQAGLRIAATIPLSQSWLLAGHVDGLAALSKSRIELNDGIVWDMPRLGALAGVDLAVIFR